MGIAVVGVAAAITLDADGTITDARLALGVIAPVPMRATVAEALAYVEAWDLNYATDSVGASIYATWFLFLTQNTVGDDLGEKLMNHRQDHSGQYVGGQLDRAKRAPLPPSPRRPHLDVAECGISSIAFHRGGGGAKCRGRADADAAIVL